MDFLLMLMVPLSLMRLLLCLGQLRPPSPAESCKPGPHPKQAHLPHGVLDMEGWEHQWASLGLSCQRGMYLGQTIPLQ